jgi:GH15 family glucan-1,4-alpha-glucosidase
VAPVLGSRPSFAYLPSTNVLTTTFRLRGGRALQLTDCMPLDPDGRPRGATMIVRRVEAVGGPVRTRIRCEPRFGYGLDPHEWNVEGAHAVARAGADRLWVGFPAPPRVVSDGLELIEEVVPGRPRAIEIAWSDRRPVAPPADALLEETIGFWREWTHSGRALFHTRAADRHRWVERSELALKLLSCGESGSFVAAVTTSLPEWPGGTRNWDYRFVWIRDAAFTAEAMLMLGHLPEAQRFLEWVVHRAARPRRTGALRVLYAAYDDADLHERELTHLRGYLASTPVRVGNGAEAQFQLDIYGELLDAASTLFLLDRDSLASLWPDLREHVAWVERVWTRPDWGIWETRGPPAHYVHSKVMAWVTFDRAQALAREFEGRPASRRWEQLAGRVRRQVLERGYDEGQEAFIRAYDQPVADAANLRLPLVGFLPADDPRIQGTVRRIEEELGPSPFLLRYRAEDGIDGPEARFLACGFWLVECLARQGEVERASAYFDQLTRASGPLDLFSEEFDPASGLALGNYPQALTHIGVLRAALALGRRPKPPGARRPR